MSSFSSVDSHALSHQPVPSDTWSSFADRLFGDFNDELERLRAAFVFVAASSETQAGEFGDEIRKNSPFDMARRRRTEQLYSQIFCRLLVCLGLPFRVLSGVKKGADFESSGQIRRLRDRGCWFAVKANDAWRLIDVFWAACCRHDSRTRHSEQVVNDAFFDAKPELLASTHHPNDESWQLLPSPITFEEFLRRPLLHPSLLDGSPPSFEHDGVGKVVVSFSNFPAFDTVEFQLLRDGVECKEFEQLRENSTFRLELLVKTPGEYAVKIFNWEGVLLLMAAFVVVSQADADEAAAAAASIQEQLSSALKDKDSSRLRRLLQEGQRVKDFKELRECREAEEFLEMLHLKERLVSAQKSKSIPDLSRCLKEFDSRRVAKNWIKEEAREEAESARLLLTQLKQKKSSKKYPKLAETGRSELASYAAPAECVFRTVQAALLLMGNYEKKTKTWTSCQNLLHDYRIPAFDSVKLASGIKKLHPGVVSRAKQILSQHKLDAIESANSAAVPLYIWVQEVIDLFESSHPNSIDHPPATIAQQKQIFRVTDEEDCQLD